MSTDDRIAALEARVAAAESFIAALRGAVTLAPLQTSIPKTWPAPPYAIGDFPCAFCGSLVCGGFHVTSDNTSTRMESGT